MNIVQRVKSPTPGFFKKIRTVGLILATVSAAVLTAPAALPLAVVNFAGYLTVASGVASAISQLATADNAPQQPLTTDIKS